MTTNTRRWRDMSIIEREVAGRKFGENRSGFGLLLECLVAADPDPSPELCALDFIERGSTGARILHQHCAITGDDPHDIIQQFLAAMRDDT